MCNIKFPLSAGVPTSLNPRARCKNNCFTSEGGGNRTNPVHAQGALENLDRFYHIVRTYPRKIPEVIGDELVAISVRVTNLFIAAGGIPAPKFHLFWHLTLKMREDGNAASYSTYEDESFNGVVAAVAKTCHFTKLPKMVLWKYFLNCLVEGVPV